MIMAGIGVSDQGLIAQLQYNRFSLTHEVVKYQEEIYSRDTLGARYVLRQSKYVNPLFELRGGYEHHYDSTKYAASYLVAIPEIGLITTHNYIRSKIVWSPAKYFYNISKQTQFPKQSLRFQPAISFVISINLEHSLWIPSSINSKKR